MDSRIQGELDIIMESILQSVDAEAIYLFGSHAYGTPVEDSDVDIYVVVPDDAVGLVELQADIRELLWKKKRVPLDLLLGRSSVFHRRRQGPTLERMIAEEGKLLYEG